jgi:hypothetical protein
VQVERVKGIEGLGERRARKIRSTAENERLMMFVFGILILLLGVAALFVLHVRTALPATTSVVSSAKDGAAQSTDASLQWLGWKLNLSEAQENEIRPVVEKEILERTALLETPEVSTTEQEAQLVDLRNSMLEEIRPVLTERQQSVLHALEQEGRS